MRALVLTPLYLIAFSLILSTADAPSPSPQTVEVRSKIATLTPQQREILGHLSIVYLDDGKGGTVKTLRISDINVQIVNGLGATNGYPRDPDSVDPLETVTNGLGNLIVGYNELGNPRGDDRTGSHNLVFGKSNTFSSFGGLVGPRGNTILGAFASVSGGRYNQAEGLSSSVSGGRYNWATGTYALVSGGRYNTASGDNSTVGGGRANQAIGMHSSVNGGSVNRATASYASVSGGQNNTAGGSNSTVGGGNFHAAPGRDDWAAGSLFEDY